MTEGLPAKVSSRLPTRRRRTGSPRKDEFTLRFDPGTIKHLGLQMYSTLPPVIGELVANAWDADSDRVEITVPDERFTDESEITVRDYGRGMDGEQVDRHYLKVGRDRRHEEGEKTPAGRRLMGRKGIGKFSGFGVAREIEVESVSPDGEVSRFQMPYESLVAGDKPDEIRFQNLEPSGKVDRGTLVTLRRIHLYRTRRPSIPQLRRGLARRFAVIDTGFQVIVNGDPITPEERDLRDYLAQDVDGRPYLWEYDEVEIREGTGWTVSGWIGALDRTAPRIEGLEPGIAVMARGKLVQEPWVFDAVVGQQYALSYLIGELHAEFADAEEDTVATSRNQLVWDTEANAAFKQWGQNEVNRIARAWADKRRSDNERRLEENPLYREFVEEADRLDDPRARRVAERLIREVIGRNPLEDEEGQRAVIQMCIDYLRFDAFVEVAEGLSNQEIADPGRLADLFRQWEVVEAREMMRVTEGRIQTIRRLQDLIEQDALEVPTLHGFLREFPWVLDPRWTLIADERRYSDLLRERFPEDELPERDRRIDFLCVREGTQLVVVEIKRPGRKATEGDLRQVEDYVHFMRDLVERSSDEDLRYVDVVGYLLVGGVTDRGVVRQKIRSLRDARIYVRSYSDLLELVRRSHQGFLERYENLRAAASD